MWKLSKFAVLSFLLVIVLMGSGIVGFALEERTTTQFMPEKTWPEWMYPYNWDKIIEQAKREGEVKIMGFGSPDEKAFYLELARKFTEKYGIKARYNHGGWFTAVQTVKTEKDLGVTEGEIDIVFLWGQPFHDLYEYEGIWNAPIVEMIPNAKKIPNYPPGIKYYHDMYPTGGTYVTPWVWIDGFLYNKKKWTRAELPDTLEGLLDWAKKHPGEVAYCDPMKGGSGHTYILSLIYALTGGYDKYAFKDFEKYEEELMANWDTLWIWLNELEKYLYKKTPYPAGNAQTIKLFEAGEISLIPMWATYIRQHITSGELDPETVGFYIPKPTIAQPFDGYAITFNSTHKAAALLFINYALSEEIQRKVSGAIGALPTDMNAWYKEAEVNPELTIDAPWWPSKKEWDYRTWIEKGPFWTRGAAVMNKMMEEWEENVARK
ncbi:extracellular solute-binding protein [Patescibacteria group bacterium]|nr:extracellular solute-binding protein [Patescibacteria group bacterium]